MRLHDLTNNVEAKAMCREMTGEDVSAIRTDGSKILPRSGSGIGGPE